MVWVKFPESHTEINLAVLPDAPSNERLELNENGSVNVSKEVGEYLLSDAYSGEVTEYNTDNGDD